VDHPWAEIQAGGWSAGFYSQGHDRPSGGEAAARGPAGVAATLKTAGAFLFLLPGGRPRRRDNEGAAAAAEAVFFPLPFGRPGLCFSETPAPLGAPVPWGAMKVEAAAAAFVVRASKVLLLRLPFGRPRFRDVEGAVSGASTSSLFSSRTWSSLAAEPLRDDMIGLGSERRGSR
jgi:hypothetical protein